MKWHWATRSLLMVALFVSACRTPHHLPPPPELPFVIGPAGSWSGQCTPVTTPPGADHQISGCITAFTFRPGVVDVTLNATGLGNLDYFTVLACQSTTACPAVKILHPSSGSGPNYSAQVPLPAPGGISKICATVQYFNPTTTPPGGPPTQPFKSLALGCVPVTPLLAAAASAFKITPTVDGLKHEGWFIDLTTDAPAQLVLGRGVPPATTIAALANGTDARSLQPWPGYSSQHGFTATLPYAGSPATTQICAWLAPSTGTSLGNPLQCFAYQEQTGAYAEATVTRGDTIHVAVRNVPSGAAVSVNLKAAAGHFWLPWKHPAIWATTADQAGSANINVSTDLLPPGQYTIAYHCAPECPGGNLAADQLIGGQSWTGSITWGPTVVVNAAVTRGLTATKPMPDKVHVVGTGFDPGETIGVFVVPPLPNFDGFPNEAAAIAYIAADAQGAFTVDVDVAGLPISGPNNQVIAFDHSHRPVAAIMFTAP
jgi:hypothetical protein